MNTPWSHCWCQCALTYKATEIPEFMRYTWMHYQVRVCLCVCVCVSVWNSDTDSWQQKWWAKVLAWSLILRLLRRNIFIWHSVGVNFRLCWNPDTVYCDIHSHAQPHDTDTGPLYFLWGIINGSLVHYMSVKGWCFVSSAAVVASQGQEEKKRDTEEGLCPVLSVSCCCCCCCHRSPLSLPTSQVSQPTRLNHTVTHEIHVWVLACTHIHTFSSPIGMIHR